MAEKQTTSDEKVERKVVKASEFKGGKPESAQAAPKKSAAGWRIFAAICWLLSIAAMVFAVIMILEGNDRLCYVGIAAAAVFCIAGGLLWKKANRVRPCSVKQDGSTGAKIKTFLWNQLGLIMAFVVFLPIGLFLLLKGDKLSKKGKTIALILTAVLLAVSGASVYDYNAPVAEAENHVDPTSVEVPAGLENVDLTLPAYFTKYGYSFHIDKNCFAISRSLTIYEGNIADALDAGKLDPCDFCTTPETLPGLVVGK